MKKYFKKLLVFLTVFALLFSLCACDPAEDIDDFMNSLFGQNDDEEDQGNGGNGGNGGGIISKPEKTDAPTGESTLAPTEEESVPSAPADGELRIHFLDVGQGDAILLTSDDATILIDTGDIKKAATQYIVDYLNSLNITRLDYLILTHPDADHIGGAPTILSTFEIGTVIMPDHAKTTAIFNRTLDAIEASGAECIFGEAGQVYTEGALQMRFLAPNSEKYSDTNDYSIAMRVLYGDTAILLTGDAEKVSEREMVQKYPASEFKADLMKAGHHGSNTSNSEALLRATDPEWIVVSCGEGNKYGHPHAEFLDRVESLGITVYRTDLEGTIVFVSDGQTITKVSNN